jgi:N-acetyl-beta-hexosaminidase
MASAEVGWTQKAKKNYINFKKRLSNLFYLLDMLGLPYAKLDEVDPNNFKRFSRFYKWFKWPAI